ncbi:MAG: hypothetical protein H6Q76_416 [Firmicutes bacterium]|nr:hypothetical protein [Bacillota bacterium]
MPPRKTKDVEISVYVTEAERNQLCRFAEIQQKSLSKFMLDAGLTVGMNTSRENQTSLKSTDLTKIKKQLFVLCRLVLFLGSSDRQHTQKEMLLLFQEVETRAGEVFGLEGE